MKPMIITHTGIGKDILSKDAAWLLEAPQHQKKDMAMDEMKQQKTESYEEHKDFRAVTLTCACDITWRVWN